MCESVDECFFFLLLKSHLQKGNNQLLSKSNICRGFHTRSGMRFSCTRVCVQHNNLPPLRCCSAKTDFVRHSVVQTQKECSAASIRPALTCFLTSERFYLDLIGKAHFFCAETVCLLRCSLFEVAPPFAYP